MEIAGLRSGYLQYKFTFVQKSAALQPLAFQSGPHVAFLSTSTETLHKPVSRFVAPRLLAILGFVC